MAKTPRIMFTPAPETYALLVRLSAATRQPMSSLVRDMVKGVEPHLETMIGLMEKAASVSDGVRVAARAAAEQAAGDLLPVLRDAERVMLNLERVFDEPGLPLGTPEPPSSNTGATSLRDPLQEAA